MFYKWIYRSKHEKTSKNTKNGGMLKTAKNPSDLHFRGFWGYPVFTPFLGSFIGLPVQKMVKNSACNLVGVPSLSIVFLRNSWECRFCAHPRKRDFWGS